MKLIFRDHAVRRMREWRVSDDEVLHVLTTGEVVESYPNDTPYPSRLVLGWCSGRPIHVVAADNPETQETIIVTVYEPDPRRWDPSFRIRRQDDQ